MRLAEVIPGSGGAGGGPDIAALAYDDRRVVPGTLFFCVPGLERDGHDFAPSAVERGAVALVVERALSIDVPQVVVADVRAAMGPAADAFEHSPSSEVDVVGVTGTNGKTTTAWLVGSLLEAAGRGCGIVGTVTTKVAGVARPAVRTTPEAIDLQRLLREMADGGDVAAAMEVSSHALALGRVDGTRFAVAVFTNLTQDHLDFHGTMDAYWAAKRRLFTELTPDASVVNVDDPRGRELAEEIDSAVTVSVGGKADWSAMEVETRIDGTAFLLDCPAGRYAVESALAGRFNVYNALEALAASAALGLPVEDGLANLSAVGGVPGRLEPVECGQPFAVLVDYAHTPDSLRNVLESARGTTSGRVLCVIGCGGDRDRGKRPLMGGIAAELSDVAILTSDNPRSEDPKAILAEVAAGAGGRATTVVDRAEAIDLAIASALPGDVVVIAGKGHEQGQDFGPGGTVPFDDRLVAAEALAGRGWVG